MKKESLKEFEKRLLKDVLNKISEGKMLAVTKMFVDFYKKNKTIYNLNGFMKSYIHCIGQALIDKISSYMFIELFMEKDFLDKNGNLNHLRNFIKINEYPLFTFLLKERFSSSARIGIIYYNEEINQFQIYFPKKKDGSNFFVKIEEKIELIDSDEEEFLNSIKEFLNPSTYSKNKLIEDLDEFISIVLNLNEEHKQLIEPLGQKLLENIKNLETKD